MTGATSWSLVGEVSVATPVSDKRKPPMITVHSLSRRAWLIGPIIISLCCNAWAQSPTSDPLGSWNDGASKRAILDFVGKVTRQGGPDFVRPDERIATFDNDGTLWSEQPMYFQLAFALDRVKALASQHPEWKDNQPFKAALEGDMKALAESGEHGMLELVIATHSGMSTDESAKIGFKTFIVSGGGIEFMRPWVERVYGIPPEQVVGSSGITKFQVGVDGQPVLMKEPKIEFVDDGPGKPVGINRFIGRRPILAFGNSDGDLQMLQWTAAGARARFIGLVHHTDAEREYAYDRNTSFGRLDKALDAAALNKWLVVDMKNDWKRIFAFE
jgi:haloacid dehalogenase-like hydrolase